MNASAGKRIRDGGDRIMAVWNFFGKIKGNVVKWWRLVILPVFHLDNNEPQTVAQQLRMNEEAAKAMSQTDTGDSMVEQKSKQRSTQYKKEKKDNSDTWWGEAMQNQTEDNEDDMFSTDRYKNVADNKDAMEILRRLEHEKQEEMLKKQKEIEEARRKAEEQERIDSILNANKVNVDVFIEEGKSGRGNTETLRSEENGEASQNEGEVKKQDDLQRAQEIIDRLNREAAEDEARKMEEIEKAREKAKEHFGG